MKKRPNLVLREPVKLYEPKKVEESQLTPEERKEKKINTPKPETRIQKEKVEVAKPILVQNLRPNSQNSIREKMSPRVQQIWDYFCRKAKNGDEIVRSFNLTRAEVMKEANIGSTNTYRDALKKFQDLNLLEIELRPGVNSGSIFTLTEQGIEEIS